MGDNLEADLSPSNQKTDISLLLDKWCEYYLSIGMSYEEYWNGSTDRLKHYFEANRLRLKQRNYELWLQGAYIYEAVGTVMTNAFAKKGSSPKGYTKEPYNIFPLTADEKKEKQRQERAKIVSTLNAFMENFNARNKK